MGKKRGHSSSSSSSSNSNNGSSGSSSDGSSTTSGSGSDTNSGSGSDTDDERRNRSREKVTKKKQSSKDEKGDRKGSKSKATKRHKIDINGGKPAESSNSELPTPPPPVQQGPPGDTPELVVEKGERSAAANSDDNGDEKKKTLKEDSSSTSARSRMAAADALKKAGGRTGGIYIPPFKLAAMQKDMAKTNKESEQYQKMKWEAMRKAINGLINKINVANIKDIVPELFEVNLVRGRGILCRSLMKAQLASPGFTHIYAALVAILNTKLPENGELLVKRVIVGFRRAYKRRDKVVATAFSKFLAHLVNHQVCHELVALQLLTVLLDEPTDDSVELAVNFTKEVGQMLEQLSPRGLMAIFDRFRDILHTGAIDKRVQYTIEGLFAVRKNGFADFPSVPEGLDLVDRSEQITFEFGLDDQLDKQEVLDIFRPDSGYQQSERLWRSIRAEILGESDADSSSSSSSSGSESDDEAGSESEDEDGPSGGGGEWAGASGIVSADKSMPVEIHDLTEQDLINLRRSIYLTIMSSAGFEECAHKLAKLDIPPGHEMELCNMLIECCSQERTYMRYYGLLGQRFCLMDRRWSMTFDKAFEEQYAMIHRLETNKLRNVSKFFSHLLITDALPWTCLE